MSEDKKAKRAPRKPSPMYVVYKGDCDIELVKVTRNGREVLELLEGTDYKYVKAEQ